MGLIWVLFCYYFISLVTGPVPAGNSPGRLVPACCRAVFNYALQCRVCRTMFNRRGTIVSCCGADKQKAKLCFVVARATRRTTSGMVSSFDNGVASLYGCGQFRRRISADFVPISLRAGVPPSAATNDMQSVRSSVSLSVCSPGSTNRPASPSRGAVHPTRPSRSAGADRPWSRGCNGSDQSIVRPPSRSARSFVRISLLRCFRH